MYRKQTETAILFSEAEGETPRYKNEKVILYTEAQCLATECSFPNVQKEMSELDSFSNPEWLVDVFRCFVSHDYNGEALGMPEWAVLDETGKLEDTLIEKLLNKVPSLILTKHKQYLLKLMEEFGIIVKPKNYNFRNDIYMPCMIKPRPFPEILRKVNDDSKYCKKSSWFCLVFNFLPPSYFNHILVSFVKNQQLLHDRNDSKLSIFRNIGIFQLNEIGSEILVICLSKNLIAVQVRQLKNEDVCYSYVKNQLINLVDLINQRYRINVTYEIRFKCADGRLLDNEGIGYVEAIGKSEYRCTDHNEMHSRKDTYRSWLKEEEVEEERKNKGHRKCNSCKNMSVYKCYDCNKLLCRDCSRKHDNEENYQRHVIQLISDSFILNCKFRVTRNIHNDTINDLKCLPNGELIVSIAIEKTVKTFSAIGIQRHNIHLEYNPLKMIVVDKNTVAVIFINRSLAIVDMQQNHVQNIRNIASSRAFIYIENEFYMCDGFDIVVRDMSGSVKRRITLSFTPYDMCYDVDSQHIYCIDREHSQLICIDRDGNDIFTFTDPNMTNLNDFTIDDQGNVLVLCRKEDNISRYCVIKVDSNGEKSEVVITNIKTSSYNPRICYDHLTKSVVIALDDEVYIYKKNESVNI
ncbi:unnamed protein product [Mytilus edulis]|uniref:B box-type domain-containing protein n=1 Tax=Mytilus edulis TaxID=6550 RepID=A0A8S3U6V8_MYTED|nr:unnamed protein product [Mytilus edulis]